MEIKLKKKSVILEFSSVISDFTVFRALADVSWGRQSDTSL